jgi:adenine-specific DNA-methyltransferase
VALDELVSLSAPSPTTKIYGADIDGAAADWAAHLVSRGVPTENLRAADFLTLIPGKELPLVAAVVGNPPYVRHHRMSAVARRRAVVAAEKAGAPLSGRASLWAYFVIHACRFVKPGGRMALLLPGAVLQADYASAVLRYVTQCFSDILLIRVAERIFEDAAEETVVLLASNANKTPISAASDCSPYQLAEVKNVAELQQLAARCDLFKQPKSKRISAIAGIAPWKLHTVRPDCIEILSRLLDNKDVCQLIDVARVSIGTVTGANNFFVLTKETATQLGVLNETIPAVSRSASLTSPLLSFHSLAHISSNNRWQMLVLPRDRVIDPCSELGQYIKEGEKQRLPDRNKCRRDPWWALSSVPIPDAFLPYTIGIPRGIALNAARAASTNTIHQVNWHHNSDQSLLRSWTFSTWSVLGRICTELYGRHYGGGVLKLEIADAQRLPVVAGLRISEQALVDCADSSALARAKADSALLSSNLGLSDREFTILQESAELLAQKRSTFPASHIGDKWNQSAAMTLS